ncbi:MAG TPA: acyl-CoA dehydrogenase family protein [Stellaceae bacterium]|jgi:SfnB family sulfur acquisition oxidoreductase|nr:acyl-CoA dehydrogenase family protein [Stellaceae bacterium]
MDDPRMDVRSAAADRLPSGHAGAELVSAAQALAPVIAAGAVERDRERIVPVDVFREIRAAGIQAARVPREFGGPEASFAELADIMLLLAKADPNVGQMLQPHFVLLDWLRIDGSAAQQKRYLGEVARGRIITNAFAERGTKRVGDARTRLRRSGTQYRLDGTKFYSTGSLIADALYVLALTEDDTAALAIVPKDRAGVEIIDDWDGMGQRTTASGTTRLTGVMLDTDEVVLLPDLGKRRTFIGAAAQITHAAIDAGIALAGLDDAAEYARTQARPVPESGVSRQADDPYVLHAIGEMSVIAHAAEAMVRRGAAILDAAAAQFLADPEPRAELDRLLAEASIAVAEAKAAATAAALKLGTMVFAVGGASATLRRHGLDRHWRNARTHTTHDPVDYKYRAIGEYRLNDRFPPITTKI